MKNDYFVAFLSPGSRKAKFQFTLYPLCAIGLPKTYSIILFKWLVRQDYMTTNRDFGQTRKNRSTSNACRIAGTHNAFVFFSYKTFIYHSWTKKTSYRMLPFSAILTKNSQVTMAKWSQSLCRRMGLNHEIFFISKSYRDISSYHFGPFPD
jgi:hypothetical protein